MQDDRDREQPARPVEPDDEATDAEPRADATGEPDVSDETAEFEMAPMASYSSSVEREPQAEPESTAEPHTAAEPDGPAEPEAESSDAGPERPAADWPAADAEAVPSTPDSAVEPMTTEREPVAWPDEPPSPPPGEAEAYPAVTPPAAGEPAATEGAHSVPATQIGETTQCPRCGTENRPGVAFCRNCGQRLVAAGVSTTVERPGTPEGTQQCPRCGTHNRAGVAFCQNCGANLRVTATPATGYVPPPAPMPAPTTTGSSAAARQPSSRGGAVLGPIVLVVGALGIVTAWLLPFPYGGGSLWDRSFGSAGGYGVAFWNGYPSVNGGFLDQAYFGFAAAAPILVAILLLLAIGGFLRASPGGLQLIGLLIALLWAIGLGVTFAILEVGGNWNGSLVDLLRALTPAGIIFLLASLIVVIGAITRLARS
jgi:hypothetical protein